MKQIPLFRKKEDGVSEVLSLVLILAVVAAVAVIVIAVYLPASASEDEQKHELLLEDQFSDLKSGLDLLWLSGGTEHLNVLFTLSGDRNLSGKLDICSTPVSFTRGEETISAPLLTVSFSKEGKPVYSYAGGALYRGNSLLLPLSVNSKNAVVFCSSSAEGTSYYATKPVSLQIKITGTKEYHDAEYGASHIDTLTLVFCSVTESAA